MIAPPVTLCGVYRSYVARGKPVALVSKRDGVWREVSTRELDDTVRAVSASLADLGLREGARLAILSENRPEWLVADYATLSLGAISVPLYPTLTPEQITYILKDSGASIVLVSNAMQLDKVLEARPGCPEIETIVVCDPPEGALPEGVLTFEKLVERGRTPARTNPELFDARLDARKPGDVVTIIYTSGTTGEPKGVMLTHGNIAADIAGCLEVVEFDPSWTAISFLPLSHVYERMVDYAYFHCGITIAYAESVEKLTENLLDVRPHVFVAVPRVYEKIHGKVVAGVEAAGWLDRKVFAAALATAKEHYEYVRRGEKPPALLDLRWKLFDRLAFSKIKSKLGGRFQFCLSGGAPLAAELADLFASMGVRIYEGYGMTETSPVVSVNSPSACRNGTVGRPLPNVEIRIAADGEIEVRGPVVMKGYWNKPQATAEVLSSDGWLSTGDIGAFDSDGFLVITDRKKELLVDAYGKNIAPQPIENALKMRNWIGQAVLIGDRRPFVSALVVPDFDRCRAWARLQKLDLPTDAAVASHPEIVRLVQADIDEVNAALAPFERVRRFALLPAELTPESGELTPTLKVKRRIVAQKYSTAIESLYAGHS